MKTDPRDVVVLGGGISGLTTAWHLKQAGVDVALLEAGKSAGGCTRTLSRDGFLLENGPFNLIVRDPAFEDLIQALGDAVCVVPADKSAKHRYVYRHNRLMPVPSNPLALATTGLLGAAARARLLMGLLCSRRPTGDEETIEQTVVRRLGRETAENLVSAAIAGIYAGDISRLSFGACFPSVARMEADIRSLLFYGLRRAMSGRKGRRTPRWRGLVSVDGGLGAITGALGAALGDDLHAGCTASAIRQTPQGYEVDYHDGAGVSHTTACRRLVLACPAAATGRLLAPLVPGAEPLLAGIESSSVVVLNLGFRATDIAHPLNGFGFLVPRSEPDFPLMGALFASSVFPHHAPHDHRLLRIFVGGPRLVATSSHADPMPAIDLDDDALLASAMSALRPLLGIKGDPMLVDVRRHRNAIPQYYLGHQERIARLRKLIEAKPGLHLAGNYLDGVSLNDCVGLATRVANQVVAEAPAPNEPPDGFSDAAAKSPGLLA